MIGLDVNLLSEIAWACIITGILFGIGLVGANIVDNHPKFGTYYFAKYGTGTLLVPYLVRYLRYFRRFLG